MWGVRGGGKTAAVTAAARVDFKLVFNSSIKCGLIRTEVRRTEEGIGGADSETVSLPDKEGFHPLDLA
ncbi:unnamed protein product, partial [Brenthis ino]